MTHADEVYHLCSLPQPDPFELPADIASPRAEAIRLLANKWDNGTILRFHFLQSSEWDWPEAQKQVVRNAFKAWKAVGMGLEFVETPTANGATLLIGRLQDGRSWSWVGTDVLSNRDKGRNMNFGWDLTTDWGHATALHEIGHAIGMPHEHQNPKSGIVWNEAAVLEYYKGPPNNWKEPAIRYNILRKLDPAEVEGSDWDVKSIMHYPFKAGLISEPASCANGTTPNYVMSANDSAWVARFYPLPGDGVPIAVGDTAALPREPGAQSSFCFTATDSREHLVETRGESDTRLMLYERRGERWAAVAAADDAARDSNAEIRADLQAGTDYLVTARTYFAAEADQYLLAIA
ncbi:MAG: hypothetical protein ACT6Q5_14255 [Sphingopyxis solisilvae]|uniref:hypothetical protein n=1 Tax=Sphingopyxis solisilvae TaxID=1886788 RepID=UPI0040355060